MRAPVPDAEKNREDTVMSASNIPQPGSSAKYLEGEPRGVDTGEFRRALGAFPTGGAIITTRVPEGYPVGMTCNSFNSVSLDPPLVLWSLAKAARSRGLFEGARHWAVNLLSSDQEALSNQFAKAGENKFVGIETVCGIGDVPLFTGCCARFQCERHAIFDGGDHIILVGRVLEFDRLERKPLVFHSGKYCHRTSDAIEAVHRTTTNFA